MDVVQADGDHHEHCGHDGRAKGIDLRFLRYILDCWTKHVPRLRAALAEHARRTPVVRLGSDREVRRWLAHLGDPR